MWHDLFVRLHVQRDQAPQPGLALQTMEIEPRILERAPEGFDHRVRIGDINLSRNAFKVGTAQLVIDISVHVLATRIGHDKRSTDVANDLLRRITQNPSRRTTTQTSLQRPRTDPPRVVVVDDRVQIRSRSVKKLDDRDVEVN